MYDYNLITGLNVKCDLEYLDVKWRFQNEIAHKYSSKDALSNDVFVSNRNSIQLIFW